MDIKLTMGIYSLNVPDVFYILKGWPEHGGKEARHARRKR